MVHPRTIIATVLAFVCTIAACDRGADRAISSSRRGYRTIVDESLRLYTRLHPLRSSHLAIRGADSLLFTFSPDEIEEATEEIERLLDAASGITPAHLDEAAVADLTFIIHWLKGERFAFEDLALYRRNPLLYCWIAEEALFGIPSRVQPPYAGERKSYEARIARIPLLLSNAARLLENPAEPHIALARERIADLRNALGELDGMLADRYGGGIAALDQVHGSLDRFSRFLESDLAKRAHGSILLGSENLSRIFLYDECLTIDASWIEREGKRVIDRLKKRSSTTRRRIEAMRQSPPSIEPQQSALDSVLSSWNHGERTFGTPGRIAVPVLQSRIEALERATSATGGLGKRPAANPHIVRSEGTVRRCPLPTNPYLTLPVARTPPLSTIPPSPFAEPPCREYIIQRPSYEAADIDEHTYALLKVLYPVREGGRIPCFAADTVRTVLSSETYREGWMHMNLEEMIDRFRMHRAELELRLIEEDIRAIARAHIVLRLHAGTFTSASAIDYLMQTIDGLSPDEAQAEYILASASPSIAYRGISLLMIDDILKQGALSQGSDPPQRLLRELMLRNAGLPLSLIRESVIE